MPLFIHTILNPQKFPYKFIASIFNTSLSLNEYRFAGTVGAIVTCPLEVVKTRLQSSSSPFYPTRLSDAARKSSIGGSEHHLKGSTQKRDICTSILGKRSQVLED